MFAQFSDFYISIDPDPLKRGKPFEHFVKWFPKADPEWSLKLSKCGCGMSGQHLDPQPRAFSGAGAVIY